MNRLTRFLTVAAASACSLSALAELAHAQGQPQTQPDGGNRGARGNRNAGGNNNAQPGDQGGRRGGGQGGFGGGMFGRGGMGDTVSTAELDKYADMLKLTKSQRDTVKTLHDAYQQDLENQQEKFRDEMRALREDAQDDPDARKQMGELFTKFRAKRQEMQTAFFSDVKATLTPEQQTQWPAVERTHRRETSMARGVVSGERVDLVKIVDDLKLSGDAKKPLEPILEQYQIDLDRELGPRNEVQDKVQTSIREMFQGGGVQNADPSKMQKLIEDGRAAANKIRDINKRYARQVEQALPDDATKAKFNEEVKHESYPLIYRPSYATRVVDAALAINGLTPEQKTSIQTIKDGFTRESGAINTKMETAYEQREQSITAQDIMGRFAGGGGGGGRGGFNMIDSPELQTLRDQRKELDDSTVEKIEKLLSEEQKAKLPQRGRGGDGGPGGAGGGGAGGGGGGGGGGRGGNGDNANPPRRNRGGGASTTPDGRT